jgi:hypothetical protein
MAAVLQISRGDHFNRAETTCAVNSALTCTDSECLRMAKLNRELGMREVYVEGLCLNASHQYANRVLQCRQLAGS